MTKSTTEQIHASDWTDAKLAERLTADRLLGRFRWAAGLGWLRWDGTRWERCPDEEVTECARLWVVGKLADTVARLKTGQASGDEIAAWTSIMSRNRLGAVVALARGVAGVLTKAQDFDADPDILNVANGVVDLKTGQLYPHNPEMLCTKIAKGCYRPGYTHPDWDTALTALPDTDTREWVQTRIGQGITGHHPPDGLIVILQGDGENGKTLITGGAYVSLGDYATMASTKLFVSKGNDHSTERADLRATRLVLAEELPEDRALNVTDLKRVADVPAIKARFIKQDNIEFETSHTLLATTNPIPVVNETDHGTWRRLAMVCFPLTFVKPPKGAGPDWAPAGANERRGDPELKQRIKIGQDQADAITTWAIEGALRWHHDGASALLMPAQVEADTLRWRKQADRITGFWADRLVPDRDACVWGVELLNAFNAWLSESGHTAWSRETFANRFGAHTMTKEHRAEKVRTRAQTGLVRLASNAPGWVYDKQPPKVADVWRGVRFRTEADDQGAEEGAPAPGPVTSANVESVRAVRTPDCNELRVRELPVTDRGTHSPHTRSTPAPTNGSSQDQHTAVPTSPPLGSLAAFYAQPTEDQEELCPSAQPTGKDLDR